MHQTVNSIVFLEGQPYEAVFDPVGLVASHVEGVAILSTLAALPHSPLHCFTKKVEKKKKTEMLSPSTSVALPTSQLGIGIHRYGRCRTCFYFFRGLQNPFLQARLLVDTFLSELMTKRMDYTKYNFQSVLNSAQLNAKCFRNFFNTVPLHNPHIFHFSIF